MIHETFERLMEADLLPMWRSNPRDIRLDGSTSGGNQSSAGRFRYNNKVWKVNFDTHYEPLVLAYAAIKKDPSYQPFEEELTPKGTALVLIDKLRRKMKNDKFKHLYIYEENGRV